MRAVLGLLLFAAPAWGWTLIGSGVGGWTTSSLTYEYNFTDCTMPEADLLAIVDQAIAVWNASPVSGLRLQRASAPVTTTVAQLLAGTATQTPLLICDNTFSSTQSVDGDFIPALTRVGTTSGHLSYAGIVLNAEAGKAAEITQLTTTGLLVALAHEMGHSLGFGHSSNTLALMYYSINGKPALLTQDDHEALGFLYPRNELQAGPYGCARAARPTKQAAGWLWVGLFFLPWGLGRMLRSRTARPAAIVGIFEMCPKPERLP